MNKILILIGIMSISFATFADCFPPKWHLPNRGNGCVKMADFGSPISSILYNCSKEDVNQLILINGTTQTNGSGEVCFVKNSVQNQNSVNASN